MADIQLHSISKSFYGHQVLKDISLQVHHGEFVTLLGPSGCGKTTLLRMIAGLETIDKGELRIGSTVYNTIPAQKRPLAMVFQSYALFPHMSVRKNILFGLQIKGVSSEQMHRKLQWALDFLQLHGLEHRLPREISGGQRQRVALARALVLDPEVLLLDEPLSNLDAALRDTAMEELKRIHRSVGKTILYVTHNQAEAMVMSERIVVLNNSTVEQFDTPMAVYDWPQTVFAAQFIGSPAMNLFYGTIARQDEELGVLTCAGFWTIDRDRASRLRVREGDKVQVGIRPHNINSTFDVSGKRYTDSAMEVTIELVEPMGDRSLVVGRTAKDCIVRFLVSRDETINIDSTITVFIDGRKMHLFDPVSQISLLSV